MTDTNFLISLYRNVPGVYRAGLGDYPRTFLGLPLSAVASAACRRIDECRFDERDEKHWKAWLMGTLLTTGSRDVLDFGMAWLEARRAERNDEFLRQAQMVLRG